MHALKQIIKRSFNHLGINVTRYHKPVALVPGGPVVVQHYRHVPIKPSPQVTMNIDVLFDVGANQGQYAADVRVEGYKKKIVSFEPLPDAYALLAEKAKKDPDWIVHPRCAVGSAPGETMINIAGNSYSSSLLPMTSAHSDSAPDSVYVGQAKTEVITLDSVFDTYVKPGERVFLKIDTQGFEKFVLEGARESLKRIAGVQLELSIVELYSGQMLYEYFFDFLKAQGFYLWSLEPGFYNPESGQLLQFDGVFARKA